MITIEAVEGQRVIEHKRRAYIRDWNLTIRKPGMSGLSKWVHLTGCVYGHDAFEDGEYITTSPILRLDIPAGIAETMNTIYVLRDDRRPQFEHHRRH